MVSYMMMGHDQNYHHVHKLSSHLLVFMSKLTITNKFATK